MKRVTSILVVMLALVSCTFGVIELKQSTATTVYVGPFYDITSGVDQELALTVTGWEAKLVRSTDVAVTLTVTASGGSNDAVHKHMGRYSLELAATDVNSLGALYLDINDVNG